MCVTFPLLYSTLTGRKREKTGENIQHTGTRWGSVSIRPSIVRVPATARRRCTASSTAGLLCIELQLSKASVTQVTIVNRLSPFTKTCSLHFMSEGKSGCDDRVSDVMNTRSCRGSARDGRGCVQSYSLFRRACNFG